MKTLTRFLIIPMLSVAFFSCSESHFLKDETYRSQVTQDFEKKKQQLPNGDLFAVFNEKLTTPEQEAFRQNSRHCSSSMPICPQVT